MFNNIHCSYGEDITANRANSEIVNNELKVQSDILMTKVLKSGGDKQ